MFDETSSNSTFLVTDEGVLVVDTCLSRGGQDLLDHIPKIAIMRSMVVNARLSGDHNYGNSVFKACDPATFVAQGTL